MTKMTKNDKTKNVTKYLVTFFNQFRNFLFQKDYETYNVKSRDVPKETEELNRALSELSNMVLSLCGKSGTIENAESLIGSKERELEILNSDLKKIENQIARLNVERDQVIA